MRASGAFILGVGLPEYAFRERPGFGLRIGCSAPARARVVPASRGPWVPRKTAPNVKGASPHQAKSTRDS